MKIAIIGTGHIGAHLARQFANRGHEVTLAFSHDEQRLQDLAQKIGHDVQVASPAAAVSMVAVVVLSVPWDVIDVAIEQMGDVTGKIVIDTTNQFSQGPVDLGGVSSLAYNQRRLPGAKVAKAFNTITAGFQAEVASGEHQPIAMFYAASDPEAKRVSSELVSSLGFVPVALDGPAEGLMEAPRRQGAVYGEGYLPADAEKIAETAKHDLAQASQLADALKQ
jgi:predicted dinucleotide-binding enzyme